MRAFIGILQALPLLIAASGTFGAQAPMAKPQWLGKEPLVIVGNWDSMPIFRRRVGGEAVDFDQQYAKQHTPEAVRKLKELGVTMGVIHFYKGFGLEAERPHMEDARKLAALLHQNGMRVGVYVGSTIGYETFLVEKPEAAEWLVEQFLGRPLYYSSQTFRKRAYFMHPGYREYIKRVLRIALEDFKADLIHFDNTSLQAQPPIFSHPLAVKDFHAWLERKYTPGQRAARYGYSEVRYMEAPLIDRPPATIDDPLLQDWTDFRCDQLAAYYAEMEAYIRGLNPQAVVESNPHQGISGRNTAWEQGVDYPRLLSHMDIVWTEEGNEAGLSTAGVLVSKIRTYKMAETLGNRIFTYTGGGRGGRLAMAESMAFNRQTLGQIGDVLSGYNFPADQKPYVSFFHDRFDLFRDVRSRPDVAVLHGYASMAFNNDLTWQSSMLVEQALIQAKVPFDIIFDPQLQDLSRYKALVLPDQECLSEDQMALIRKYVEGGGGLVATEQTSLYDGWRRRRENYGLSGVLGVTAPKYRENLYTFRPLGSQPGTALPARETAAAAAAPVRNKAGSGRSSYIPQVRPSVSKPPLAAMTSQYWKLPVNWQQIVDEVRWAAGGLSLEVKGPLTLVAEPQEQASTGRVLIHLLNYDARRSVQEGVAVTLRVPAGKTVRAVRLYSPDSTATPTLTHTASGGSVSFTVPGVKTYSIAAVEMR